MREIARREEIESFKNRFYANITHEFRTPLTVVLGMAGSLRENPNAAAREAGLLVERNGQNLLRLVNQLLDLSKIESGALLLHPVSANAMQFVKVTAESFESLAAMKKQRLIVQTEPSVFFIDFDPDKLQQVLANLIGNALKFTPEGGEITVFAQFVETKKQLDISVRDTGIGIQETLPYIFDRFYRVEDGTGSTNRGHRYWPGPGKRTGVADGWQHHGIEYFGRRQLVCCQAARRAKCTPSRAGRSFEIRPANPFHFNKSDGLPDAPACRRQP